MRGTQKGHILLISYYWPPSGGPGVQRSLKFVKYLVRLGWRITVLTVKNGEYPVLDPGLESEIPPEVRVYKAKAISYFNWYKRLSGQDSKKGLDTFILNKKNPGLVSRIARWVRMNFFIPDARVGWIAQAVKEGRTLIRAQRPDLILSSSPPHSLQLIAQKLYREFDIPWIADFRDPWTKAFWDSGMKRMSRAERKNKEMERSVLRDADKVITVSRGVMELLPVDPAKVTIIPNGWDEEDFGNCVGRPNKKFTIRYAGYMAESQNPVAFLDALAALPEEVKSLVQVEMYGRQDEVVHEAIRTRGIARLFDFKEYIPHGQIIDKICQAEMLLLVIPKEYGTGILTGKLFEYLATRNFILGIGNPSGEAAEILRQCKAGVMVAHDQSPLEILKNQIKRWQNGEEFRPDEKAIARYSRRALTAKLDKVLSACK